METKRKISDIIRESAMTYYNYVLQAGGSSEALNIERDFVCTRIVAHIASGDEVIEIFPRVNKKDMTNIAIPLYFFRDSKHPVKLPTPYFFPAGTEVSVGNISSASTDSYVIFEGFFVKDLLRKYMDKLFIPFIYAIKDEYTAGATYTSSTPLTIVRDSDFQLTALSSFAYDKTSTSILSELNFMCNLSKQNGIKLYDNDVYGNIMFGDPDFPHRLTLPITFMGGTAILPKITIASGAYSHNTDIWRFLIGRKV